MYCRKCGLDMGSSNTCPRCGTDANIPEYDPEIVGQSKSSGNNSNSSGVSCPHCGSDNCQPMNETNVTGGGYDPTSGCCGYFLFGPLGLLCGACGNDTRSTTRTYWICKNCGKRFNL